MSGCTDEAEGGSPYMTRAGARELALLGLGRGSELALVQKTAEQQAQLTSASERIDSLERQRLWMLGGLGVSTLVIVVLAIRGRKKDDKSAAAPEGQRA